MRRQAAIIMASVMAMTLMAGAAGEIPGDVVALFQKRCAGCHKGNKPPRGLSFEPAQIAAAIDAPSREVPALKIIDTKSPEASYLLKKIRREKDITGSGMPPRQVLTPAEIGVFAAWVRSLKPAGQ